MGKLLVVVAMLGACAVDDEPAPRSIPVPVAEATKTDAPMDDTLCGLVAALPDDDMCSLACDPDALATRMESDGFAPGRCYQLHCALAEIDFSVGICLL